MKIEFFWVSGQVGIDDQHSFQEARTGMTLETESKPYIIVTGDNSHAQMLINSKEISITSNSVLHINWSRPAKYRRGGAYDSLKLISGRLWLKIVDFAGTEPDRELNISGGGGIRG